MRLLRKIYNIIQLALVLLLTLVIKKFGKDIESMKYTTVKYSEIAKDPTMRLDAKYWIRKKNVQSNIKRKIQREKD